VTTTIGALLSGVVTSRQAHVVTIEETLEFQMPASRSLVSQRQLGVHVEDMARAVRSVAHEDADLIAIGDLSSAADVALALSLAHGGHMVLAGAHARGAADCLNRMLRPFGKHDQGQARTMLARTLRAVVSQQLVMRADGKGRVPAIELIVATPAVSDMILRGGPIDIAALTASGKAQKLVTLTDSLQRLVIAGTITAAEADRVTLNRVRQA
jgi:twitching motility protein PilT